MHPSWHHPAAASPGAERILLSLVPRAVADLRAGAGGDAGGDGEQGGATRKVSQLAEEMLGVEISASTVSNLVSAIEAC